MHEAVAPAPITEYLARVGLSGARVVPLTGDASDRRYVRVIADDASHAVLAIHAAPFSYATLPFVNVAQLLSEMPVPVPRILGHADDLGILALEDLGDVTLQAHVGTNAAAAHAALYRQAVTFIDMIQRRGRELASVKYVPYGIAFDDDKLTWEMDFFIKHFLEAYRGIVLSSEARVALRHELGVLVSELAAEPRVLCHRDYHSRNLMLAGDRLCIIDFQDARMGPDTYDLVSLLRDSYVDIGAADADALIDYFLSLQGRTSERGAYRRRFDVMALERNLKALGTFGYQATARRNPVYIQYIPRTLRYAGETLRAQMRFTRLREMLASLLPELCT
jgi:aminoglycoside/choline kinase family phosphotransferase